MTFIPFNQSYVSGKEDQYVCEAIKSRALAGDGPFTKKVQEKITSHVGVGRSLFTHSGTAALEMAALLSNLVPGDEVIMPSFTFVSTANAFVLRGAVPVFIDIRPDTLNLDESLLEQAITARTKVIVPVHYAGVSCEMDVIMNCAKAHNLLVVEDAAQALYSRFKGIPLGGIGDMGAFSFHATKNIGCGEGGAFVANSPELAERAEIIREKGTNRSKFFRGQVDKYSWVDIGSSYLPSELNAAYLLAQLEVGQLITNQRLEIWGRYHDAFMSLERDGLARRPIIPQGCEHNGHIYYLLMPSLDSRDQFIAYMKGCGIGLSFHYVPLHSTDYAATCSRVGSNMSNTDSLSSRLVRFPVWPGIESKIDYVIEKAYEFFGLPT